MSRRNGSFVLLLLWALLQMGCGLNPLASATPTLAPNSLVYDAPVTLSIKNGTLLPGTTVGYAGKTPTGAAKVLLSGLVAAKQIGDSLEWKGTPAQNANVNLSTRVVVFDDESISLAGTAHIDLAKIAIQPGLTSDPILMEFNAPVTYSLSKGGNPVPGSTVAYKGSSAEGAQFSGIDGYPYRKTLDSLQYVGRLGPKIALKLDLRLLNFSDSSVLLGGTANIRIAP